jgi:hypothetical protein
MLAHLSQQCALGWTRAMPHQAKITSMNLFFALSLGQKTYKNKKIKKIYFYFQLVKDMLSGMREGYNPNSSMHVFMYQVCGIKINAFSFSDAN